MNSYKISFNQDFTSISVLGPNGYRLFSLSTVDKLEEIYFNENEDIIIAERLFNSSLVVLVQSSKPNCLKMLHFKKKQDICNCVYPSNVLSIRMNRKRLVVCLAESIHIHDIRDMKVLHSIGNISPNEMGLCSLSLNSNLAFPISATSGELQIFNVDTLRPGLVIKAHETMLSALNFSSNGNLLATASERGTVIRVFCVKNGQKVHEFRRGMKRCVRISSLVFSTNGEYLCASSNTETIHIFKIDSKALEAAEKRLITDNCDVGTSSLEDLNPSTPSNEKHLSWSGYITKAVTSYLPNPVYDVFSQDRAFATAQLNQTGYKHICALAKIQKEHKLIVVCEDGFLYVYEFNDTQGGNCRMIRGHDLRSPLEDVIELDITEGNSSSQGQRNVIIIDGERTTSYASVLKGNNNSKMTESEKYRSLTEALEVPPKALFDEKQFPPVASA